MNRSHSHALILTLALALSASTLRAHGPQLQITNDGGKITTREVLQDEPYAPLTSPKSVYVIDLLPSSGQYFTRPNDTEAAPGIPEFNSGPGIAFGVGATFNPGFNFQLHFTDGLKLWNGASFADPGTEQIQVFRGSFSNPSATALTSDAGPFAFLSFSTIAAGYNANAHGSASFRILGDGVNPTSASDDGIYLLSLKLASTDPTVAPSDPYYFVLRKNAPLADAMIAARSLAADGTAIQVVPEVGSFALAGATLAGLSLVAAQRRRTH